MSTTTLTRNLRARQSASRCDGMAAVQERRAARYPEGSALRADYLSLAADYRDTAAQWRALVEEEPEERCPCGCGLTEAEHDAEAALDDDAAAYADRCTD
jgi:hypothetical protein